MKTLRIISALLLLVSAAVTAFLIPRAAAFQRYNPGQPPGVYFGRPYNTSWRYILQPHNYTAPGARMIHWLWFSLAVVVVSFLTLIGTLW